MRPTLHRRRTDFEPRDSASLRALIVDDNPDYLTFAAAMVRRFGFIAVACNDPQIALGELATGSFDILIIDYEMPKMTGLDFIVAARRDPRHTDAFAVMLTGHEHTDLKITALRLGYDDFIMKSALDQELEAKLTAARRVVSRQRRLDATLRELYGMATRDELTGLHNRRFFFGETDRLLQEGTVANLIFFDLDDFKLINDQYGHLAGDRILRDLGTLFLARTRHEDLIARFGGDEFIMLIGRLAPAEVEGIGSRLAREIGECHWTFGTDDVSLSVTTGIACSSLLELPTVTRLLSACDRDLYKNKWLRKHPAEDPALYAYDSRRDAEIVDLWDDTVSEQAETTIE